MKRMVAIVGAAAAMAVGAAGWEWQLEGMWNATYTYHSQAIAVAPNGNVYVDGSHPGYPIVYYTPAGSFLGSWLRPPDSVCGPHWLAVASNGWVYANIYDGGYRWWTADGSLLGSVTNIPAYGVDVSGGGTVYVPPGQGGGFIRLYTQGGSLIGSWATSAPVMHVAVAPNANIYGIGYDGYIYYFSPAGSFLGSWDTGFGSVVYGGIEVGPDGVVYAANNKSVGRVVYFTKTGSFLGSINYSMNYAADVAFSPGGGRLYVITDFGFYGRVYYFNRNESGVTPASLGKIKALFK